MNECDDGEETDDVDLRVFPPFLTHHLLSELTGKSPCKVYIIATESHSGLPLICSFAFSVSVTRGQLQFKNIKWKVPAINRLSFKVHTSLSTSVHLSTYALSSHVIPGRLSTGQGGILRNHIHITLNTVYRDNCPLLLLLLLIFYCA